MNDNDEGLDFSILLAKAFRGLTVQGVSSIVGSVGSTVNAAFEGIDESHGFYPVHMKELARVLPVTNAQCIYLLELSICFVDYFSGNSGDAGSLNALESILVSFFDISMNVLSCPMALEDSVELVFARLNNIFDRDLECDAPECEIPDFSSATMRGRGFNVVSDEGSHGIFTRHADCDLIDSISIRSSPDYMCFSVFKVHGFPSRMLHICVDALRRISDIADAVVDRVTLALIRSVLTFYASRGFPTENCEVVDVLQALLDSLKYFVPRHASSESPTCNLEDLKDTYKSILQVVLPLAPSDTLFLVSRFFMSSLLCDEAVHLEYIHRSQLIIPTSLKDLAYFDSKIAPFFPALTSTPELIESVVVSLKFYGHMIVWANTVELLRSNVDTVLYKDSYIEIEGYAAKLDAPLSKDERAHLTMGFSKNGTVLFDKILLLFSIYPTLKCMGLAGDCVELLSLLISESMDVITLDFTFEIRQLDALISLSLGLDEDFKDTSAYTQLWSFVKHLMICSSTDSKSVYIFRSFCDKTDNSLCINLPSRALYLLELAISTTTDMSSITAASKQMLQKFSSTQSSSLHPVKFRNYIALLGSIYNQCSLSDKKLMLCDFVDFFGSFIALNTIRFPSYFHPNLVPLISLYQFLLSTHDSEPLGTVDFSSFLLSDADTDVKSLLLPGMSLELCATHVSCEDLVWDLLLRLRISMADTATHELLPDSYPTVFMEFSMLLLCLPPHSELVDCIASVSFGGIVDIMDPLILFAVMRAVRAIQTNTGMEEFNHSPFMWLLDVSDLIIKLGFNSSLTPPWWHSAAFDIILSALYSQLQFTTSGVPESYDLASMAYVQVVNILHAYSHRIAKVTWARTDIPSECTRMGKALIFQALSLGIYPLSFIEIEESEIANISVPTTLSKAETLLGVSAYHIASHDSLFSSRLVFAHGLELAKLITSSWDIDSLPKEASNTLKDVLFYSHNSFFFRFSLTTPYVVAQAFKETFGLELLSMTATIRMLNDVLVQPSGILECTKLEILTPSLVSLRNLTLYPLTSDIISEVVNCLTELLVLLPEYTCTMDLCLYLMRADLRICKAFYDSFASDVIVNHVIDTFLSKGSSDKANFGIPLSYTAQEILLCIVTMTPGYFTSEIDNRILNCLIPRMFSITDLEVTTIHACFIVAVHLSIRANRLGQCVRSITKSVIEMSLTPTFSICVLSILECLFDTATTSMSSPVRCSQKEQFICNTCPNNSNRICFQCAITSHTGHDLMYLVSSSTACSVCTCNSSNRCKLNNNFKDDTVGILGLMWVEACIETFRADPSLYSCVWDCLEHLTLQLDVPIRSSGHPSAFSCLSYANVFRRGSFLERETESSSTPSLMDSEYIQLRNSYAINRNLITFLDESTMSVGDLRSVLVFDVARSFHRTTMEIDNDELDPEFTECTRIKLSESYVPFQIIGLLSNPSDPNIVAVYGMRDCHILRFCSGLLVNRYVIELAFDMLSPNYSSPLYLTTVEWHPIIPLLLSFTTSHFVRIFDISHDLFVPISILECPPGLGMAITDSTFALSATGEVSLFVCTPEHGVRFSKVSPGQNYFVSVLPGVRGAGYSIFYSMSTMCLFVSLVTDGVHVLKLDCNNESILAEHNTVDYSKCSSNPISLKLCGWKDAHSFPNMVACVHYTPASTQLLIFELEDDVCKWRSWKFSSDANVVGMASAMNSIFNGLAVLHSDGSITRLLEDGKLMDIDTSSCRLPSPSDVIVSSLRFSSPYIPDMTVFSSSQMEYLQLGDSHNMFSSDSTDLSSYFGQPVDLGNVDIVSTQDNRLLISLSKTNFLHGLGDSRSITGIVLKTGMSPSGTQPVCLSFPEIPRIVHVTPGDAREVCVPFSRVEQQRLKELLEDRLILVVTSEFGKPSLLGLTLYTASDNDSFKSNSPKSRGYIHVSVDSRSLLGAISRTMNLVTERARMSKAPEEVLKKLLLTNSGNDSLRSVHDATESLDNTFNDLYIQVRRSMDSNREWSFALIHTLLLSLHGSSSILDFAISNPEFASLLSGVLDYFGTVLKHPFFPSGIDLVALVNLMTEIVNYYYLKDENSTVARTVLHSLLGFLSLGKHNLAITTAAILVPFIGSGVSGMFYPLVLDIPSADNDTHCAKDISSGHSLLYRCDICNVQIRHSRFHCMHDTCGDFDLCESCLNNGDFSDTTHEASHHVKLIAMVPNIEKANVPALSGIEINRLNSLLVPEYVDPDDEILLFEMAKKMSLGAAIGDDDDSIPDKVQIQAARCTVELLVKCDLSQFSQPFLSLLPILSTLLPCIYVVLRADSDDDYGVVSSLLDNILLASCSKQTSLESRVILLAFINNAFKRMNPELQVIVSKRFARVNKFSLLEEEFSACAFSVTLYSAPNAPNITIESLGRLLSLFVPVKLPTSGEPFENPRLALVEQTLFFWDNLGSNLPLSVNRNSLLFDLCRNAKFFHLKECMTSILTVSLGDDLEKSIFFFNFNDLFDSLARSSNEKDLSIDSLEEIHSKFDNARAICIARSSLVYSYFIQHLELARMLFDRCLHRGPFTNSSLVVLALGFASDKPAGLIVVDEVYEFTSYCIDKLDAFMATSLLNQRDASVRRYAISFCAFLWETSSESKRPVYIQTIIGWLRASPLYGSQSSELLEIVILLVSRLQSCDVSSHYLISEILNSYSDVVRKSLEVHSTHKRTLSVGSVMKLCPSDSYIASEFCTICCFPTKNFKNITSEMLSAEHKYTHNSIAIFSDSMYEINQVRIGLRPSPNASKLAKQIDVYYSSLDLQPDTASNQENWKLLASRAVSLQEEDIILDIQMPVCISGLKLVISECHEFVNGKLEATRCPRCRVLVSNKSFICNNCQECAIQCRQCRSIDYDHLDAFFCHECGFSKHCVVKVTLSACEWFAIPPLKSEGDRTEALDILGDYFEKLEGCQDGFVTTRNALSLSAEKILGGLSGSQKAFDVLQRTYSSEFNAIALLNLAVYGIRHAISDFEGRTDFSPVNSLELHVDEFCLACVKSFSFNSIKLLATLGRIKGVGSSLVRSGFVDQLLSHLLSVSDETLSLQIIETMSRLSCQVPCFHEELLGILLSRIQVLCSVSSHSEVLRLSRCIQLVTHLIANFSDAMGNRMWQQHSVFLLNILFSTPVVTEASGSLRKWDVIVLPVLNVLKVKLNETSRDCPDDLNLTGSFTSFLDSSLTLARWNSSRSRHTQEVMLEASSLSETSWFATCVLSPNQSVREVSCGILRALCTNATRSTSILGFLSMLLGKSLKRPAFCLDHLRILNQLLVEFKEASAVVVGTSLIGVLMEGVADQTERLRDFEVTQSPQLSGPECLQGILQILSTVVPMKTTTTYLKQRNHVFTLLSCYIDLSEVVLTRSQITQSCCTLILGIMRDLFAQGDEDRSFQLKMYFDALRDVNCKGRGPLYILEQICSVISPVKVENDFFMVLKKSRSQEEYIQKSMTRNPYCSTDIPYSGPELLMSDVRDKICRDLELPDALPMFELLVCNKIISLDLPVTLVYEKVFKVFNEDITAQGSYGDPDDYDSEIEDDMDPGATMVVVYRLRGLDGEATEDVIDELTDNSENVDPEVAYKFCNVIAECGGIETLVLRLNGLDTISNDLHRHEMGLLSSVLTMACRIKSNRIFLIDLGVSVMTILIQKLLVAMQDSSMVSTTTALLDLVILLFQEANSLTSSFVNNPLLLDSLDLENARRFISHILDLLKSKQTYDRNVFKILFHSTFGQEELISVIFDFFSEYTDWKSYQGAMETDDIDICLDAFVILVNSIGSNQASDRIRMCAANSGFLDSSFEFVSSLELPTTIGTKKDRELLKAKLEDQKALPFVLQVIDGLCKDSISLREVVLSRNLLKNLHMLERMSTLAEVGTFAENALKSLATISEDICAEIAALREATKYEKRKLALAKRKKMLGTLGFKEQSGGSKLTANRSISGIDAVVEVSGMRCKVCLEGFEQRPRDMMGIYVLNREEYSDQDEPRLVTVTHFNTIHFKCHRDAVRADKKLKQPKMEWDGATLRNSHTLCNNLFPILHATTSPEEYKDRVEDYWRCISFRNNLMDGPIVSLPQDLANLALTFATGKSFSIFSRGGGRESNIRLFPYMLQMIIFHISRLSEQDQTSLCNSFGAYSPATRALDIEDTLIDSLIFADETAWSQKRVPFLQTYIEASARESYHRDRKTAILFWGLIDKVHQILNSFETELDDKIWKTRGTLLRKWHIAITDSLWRFMSATYAHLVDSNSEEMVEESLASGVLHKTMSNK